MNKKLKCYTIGIITSIGIFFLFGSVASLIPNSYFIRMTPANTYDLIFLTLSSLLLGAFVGVHFYKMNNKCTIPTTAGGIGSFLAFSCPICNHILVLLFGSTLLMTYLEPARPAIGVISIIILSGALYWKIRKT